MSPESICRACASTEGPFESLFTYVYDGKPLKAILTLFTSIKIVEDALPSVLCVKCLDTLLIAYEFRIQCLRTDDNFRVFELLEEFETELEFQIPKESEKLNKNLEKPQCEVCGKFFTKSSSLKYHLRLHDNNRKFRCPECDLSFINQSQLTVHYRKHNGAKPYKCKICQKTFAKSSNLNVHTLTHVNSKPFHCTICSKQFSQLVHLNNHKKVHTGARPYKCTQCEQGFITKTHLKTHLNVHFNVKNYLCNNCGKAFTSQGDLTRHLLIHNELKFNCDQCQKEFHQANSLKTHMKKCHI